jgi:hypothetical protein
VDKQNNNENQIKKVIYIQARISSTRLSPCLKKLISIHLFFRSKKSPDPALHVKTSNIEINNYLSNNFVKPPSYTYSKHTCHHLRYPNTHFNPNIIVSTFIYPINKFFSTYATFTYTMLHSHIPFMLRTS